MKLEIISYVLSLQEQKRNISLMKAVLISLGTRGDIEPFLAIAQLLTTRKWDVICVFPEQFRETVKEMGISFIGFGKEFLELMDREDAKKFMGGQGSIFKRLRTFIRMARAGMKLSNEIITLQHSIQIQEKPDKVIYHPKCNYALVWGIENPGKSLMVSPIPFMTHPIDHMTPLGGNYGKLLNRLSFWLVNTIKALVLKIIARKYHKDYSGTMITVSSLRKAMLEKEKSYYTISPSLFPRPSYWPAQAKVVGHYERDKTAGWMPSDDLIKFLEKHKKIVFITFGSMSNSNPREKTRIIVNVLKRNNVSAIINTSWGGLEEIDERPENIYYVNNIPYTWIFPKIYAVIHHGGSGTTHSALKCACPSLIVPHVLDQFYWSKTISDLNLGPKGLSIKNLVEKKFEYKLLDLMNNPSYKKNATIISEQMRGESDFDKLYDMIIN